MCADLNPIDLLGTILKSSDLSRLCSKLLLSTVQHTHIHIYSNWEGVVATGNKSQMFFFFSVAKFKYKIVYDTFHCAPSLFCISFSSNKIFEMLYGIKLLVTGKIRQHIKKNTHTAKHTSGFDCGVTPS